MCLPWKNWVNYLPRVAFNTSNIMVLALQAQKSNFVITLKTLKIRVTWIKFTKSDVYNQNVSLFIMRKNLQWKLECSKSEGPVHSLPIHKITWKSNNSKLTGDHSIRQMEWDQLYHGTNWNRLVYIPFHSKKDLFKGPEY